MSGEVLNSGEMFWYNHRDWLKTHGYVLHARYQVGWTPSWKGTKKDRNSCEDGLMRSVSILSCSQLFLIFTSFLHHFPVHAHHAFRVGGDIPK
ncbi:hypothetical protein DFH09DRAFT_903835 [Mycena vulgaris]|nr:hypothetical protein DFH09DRAFT_903835 [Mycena vulgaris]